VENDVDRASSTPWAISSNFQASAQLGHFQTESFVTVIYPSDISANEMKTFPSFFSDSFADQIQVLFMPGSKVVKPDHPLI
jgi:hypothetical protein